LPASPLQSINLMLLDSKLLSYINWLIPVDLMLSFLSYWLLCVAGYYIYSVLMRWVKLIGD